MANAVLHGNLGISSSDKAWSDTVREELERHPEKMKKKVIVEIDITRKRVQVKITDEGEGFEASQVPNPTDSANLMKTTGRGIFYMKSFFDTVKHEGKGNITILSKERK
jgi:anti-sigma regulatory factor (Ser/Thr protein kinase)